MFTHEEKKILSTVKDRRIRRVLAHAAAHRKLYNEIEELKHERDESKKILDVIYHQMVTCESTGPAIHDPGTTLKKWKIMIGDGVFYEFDGLTQDEAKIIWRDAWGLN